MTTPDVEMKPFQLAEDFIKNLLLSDIIVNSDGFDIEFSQGKNNLVLRETHVFEYFHGVLVDAVFLAFIDVLVHHLLALGKFGEICIVCLTCWLVVVVWRIDLRPGGRRFCKFLGVRQVELGHLGVLRVGWFWALQQTLERDEGALQREDRRPCVLENVQADGAGLRRDVWVVHPCVELHDGRLERILGRDLDVHLEQPAFVGRARWPDKRALEVGEVVIFRHL